MSTIAAAALGGCGAGQEAAPVAHPPCVAAADVAADLGRPVAGTALALAAVDDRFEPACVRLPAAGPVTLVVRNDGSHPHDLTLPDGRQVGVDAGQVAILEAEVGPGGLSYVCTIHAGMAGRIDAGR